MSPRRSAKTKVPGKIRSPSESPYESGATVAAPIARDVMVSYFNKKERLAESARIKQSPASSFAAAITPPSPKPEPPPPAIKPVDPDAIP